MKRYGEVYGHKRPRFRVTDDHLKGVVVGVLGAMLILLVLEGTSQCAGDTEETRFYDLEVIE